jgi:hypothetical protein
MMSKVMSENNAEAQRQNQNTKISPRREMQAVRWQGYRMNT